MGFVREVASDAADAQQPEKLLPEKFKEQAAEQSVQKDADASVERVPRQTIQNTNILIDNDRRDGGGGRHGGGCRHGGCHHGHHGCLHGDCGGHCHHSDCHRGGGFGLFGRFGIGGGIFGGK